MRSELAAKVAWVCIGLAIAWMARALGLGTLAEPGPGMLACALGVLIAAVAAAGAARLFIGPSVAATRMPAGGALRIAGLCIGLVAYIAALVPVGFPIATFAFLVALFAVFAQVSWPRAIAISAGVTLASYALFRYGLGTQLPAGLLG